MNKSSDKKGKWYRRNKLKQSQELSADDIQENLKEEVRRVVANDDLKRHASSSAQIVKPKRVLNEFSSEDYFPTAKRDMSSYSSKFDFSDDLDMSSGAFPSVSERPKLRRISMDEERQMTVDFSNTAMLNLSSNLVENFPENRESNLQTEEDEDAFYYGDERIDRDKQAFFKEFSNYQQEQKRAYDEAQRNFNETQRINLEDDFSNLARNESYHSQTERMDFAPWTSDDFTFLNDYSEDEEESREELLYTNQEKKENRYQDEDFDADEDEIEILDANSPADFERDKFNSDSDYLASSSNDEKFEELNYEFSDNDEEYDVKSDEAPTGQDKEDSSLENFTTEKDLNGDSSEVLAQVEDSSDLREPIAEAEYEGVDSEASQLFDFSEEKSLEDSDQVTDENLDEAISIRKIPAENEELGNQVREISIPLESTNDTNEEDGHEFVDYRENGEASIANKLVDSFSDNEAVEEHTKENVEEHIDLEENQYVDSYGETYQDPFSQGEEGTIVNSYQEKQEDEDFANEDEYVPSNESSENFEYVDLSIFSEEELEALGLHREDKIEINQFNDLYYSLFEDATDSGQDNRESEESYNLLENQEGNELAYSAENDLEAENEISEQEEKKQENEKFSPRSFFRNLFKRNKEDEENELEENSLEDLSSEFKLSEDNSRALSDENLQEISDIEPLLKEETNNIDVLNKQNEIVNTESSAYHERDSEIASDLGLKVEKVEVENLGKIEDNVKLASNESEKQSVEPANKREKLELAELGEEQEQEKQEEQEDYKEGYQADYKEINNNEDINLYEGSTSESDDEENTNANSFIKKINLKDHLRRINNWFRGEVDANDSLTARPQSSSRPVKLDVEEIEKLNIEDNDRIKEKINKSKPTPILKNRDQQSERLRQRDYVSNNFAKKRARANRPLDILELPESPVILLSEAEKELNPSRMIIPAKIDIFKEGSSKSQVLYEILDWIKVLLIAVVVGLFLVNFVVQRNEVNGRSMVPTLQNGDQLIVQKVSRYFSLPKYGDIITFVHPDKQRTKDNHLVKRVIGLPGDRIEIRNEKVYRNGIELDEPYLAEGTVTARAEKGYDDIVLEDNQIFVLGDNRSVSADSRIFGPINKDAVEGQILFRVYPFGSFGIPR